MKPFATKFRDPGRAGDFARLASGEPDISCIRIDQRIRAAAASADPLRLRNPFGMKPFAIGLYERHLMGMTAAQLAAELQIPLWRIEQRLQAAAAHLAKRRRLLSWPN